MTSGSRSPAHGLDDVPRDRLLNDARPAELVERPDHLVEHIAHDFGRLGIEAAIRDEGEDHG